MEDKDTAAVGETAEKKKRPPRNRGRRGGHGRGGNSPAENKPNADKPHDHSPAEGKEAREGAPRENHPRENHVRDNDNKEKKEPREPKEGEQSRPRSGKRPSRYNHRRRGGRPRGERKPDAPLNEPIREITEVLPEEVPEEDVFPVEEVPESPVFEEAPAQNLADEEPVWPEDDPTEEQEAEPEVLPPAEAEPEEPDVEIVGIRFRQSGKIYYFAPGEWKLAPQSHAIVETARGIEYGTVVIGNSFVRAAEIVPPLRNVIRQANEEDEKHYEENVRKEIEAYNVCVDKICDHKLAMKLIDAEYTFDNNKLLFYFTHDGRVDFRDLVKDLASVFRTRIEMRQINIRDEAKMMGGLGICGRPFCCHSFLGDFVQVSIKMAKEQNLSLNSAKISGGCGRLTTALLL